jgi:hypothetical protein
MGCRVELILESYATCEWCEFLFNLYREDLTRNSNPLLISSGNSASTTAGRLIGGEKHTRGNTCPSMFVSKDYSHLNRFFYNTDSRAKNFEYGLWFIFVLKDQKPEFLKAWESFVEGNFEDLTAKTILLTVNDIELTGMYKSKNVIPANVEIGCYLCPAASSYFIHYDQDTRVSTTLQGLNGKYKELNSNGYQQVLKTSGYFSPSESWAGKETRYFLRNGAWRNRGASPVYLLSIAASHLNFSLTSIPPESNKKPGLVLCFDCDDHYPSPNYNNIKMFILFINSESFIYCQSRIAFQSISITSVLFVPYDLRTWISLLLVFIVLCVSPKMTLWRTMDLMWSILGQPPQNQKNGFLTILCFSVIFLQQIYLSYFTSNVVKPFEKTYIDSNKELILESPFRILVTENKSQSAYSTEFHKMYEESFSKLGLSINQSNFEDYFFYFKDAAKDSREDDLETKPEDHKKVAMARDQGTTIFYRKFQKQYIIAAEASEPGVNCHMLKETWGVERLWIYFHGHLTQSFNEFFRSIFMSGIDIYWDKAYFNHFDRETRRAAEKQKPIRNWDSTGVGEASMKTSLSSFFKLFLILLGLDLVLFFVELLAPRDGLQVLLNVLKLKFWY